MNNNVFKSKLGMKIGMVSSYAFFSLMILAKAIGLDSTKRVYYILAVIAGGCWLIHCFFQEITFLQMVFSGSILSIALVTTFVSGKLGFALTMMAIVCTRNIRIDDIFKLFFAVWIVGYVAVIFGVLLGIIQDISFIDGRGNARHSFGYLTGNLFHATFSILVGLWMYLRKENTRLIEIAVICLVDLAVFRLSGSITGTTIGLMIPLSFYVCKYIGRVSILKKTAMWFMCICDFLTVVIGFVYPIIADSQQYWGKWYSTLIHRFSLTNDAFKAYSITMFGRNDMSIILDNAYVYVIHQYGLFPFFSMLGIYVVALGYLVKKNRLFDVTIISIFIAYGFFEQLFNTAFMNFTWLIVGSVIMNEICGKSKMFD